MTDHRTSAWADPDGQRLAAAARAYRRSLEVLSSLSATSAQVVDTGGWLLAIRVPLPGRDAHLLVTDQFGDLPARRSTLERWWVGLSCGDGCDGLTHELADGPLRVGERRWMSEDASDAALAGVAAHVARDIAPGMTRCPDLAHLGRFAFAAAPVRNDDRAACGGCGGPLKRAEKALDVPHGPDRPWPQASGDVTTVHAACVRIDWACPECGGTDFAAANGLPEPRPAFEPVRCGACRVTVRYDTGIVVTPAATAERARLTDRGPLAAPFGVATGRPGPPVVPAGWGGALRQALGRIGRAGSTTGLGLDR